MKKIVAALCVYVHTCFLTLCCMLKDDIRKSKEVIASLIYLV